MAGGGGSRDASGGGGFEGVGGVLWGWLGFRLRRYWDFLDADLGGLDPFEDFGFLVKEAHCWEWATAPGGDAERNGIARLYRGGLVGFATERAQKEQTWKDSSKDCMLYKGNIGGKYAMNSWSGNAEKRMMHSRK